MIYCTMRKTYQTNSTQGRDSKHVKWLVEKCNGFSTVNNNNGQCFNITVTFIIQMASSAQEPVIYMALSAFC